MTLFDELDTFKYKTKYFSNFGNWYKIFNNNIDVALSNVIPKVLEEYGRTRVEPDWNDVFRIFKDCEYDKTKVVILGQDPYYNGNANGYAFGCKENVSASLLHILKSIRSNTPEDILMNKEPINDASLRYLVEQGVFLLNTVLTVRFNEPASHINIGWQDFTKEIIKLLDKKNNIVFMLWGNYAKSYEPFLTNKNNLVLEWSHPASAARNSIEWNCQHFKQCNDFFKSHRIKTIDWF